MNPPECFTEEFAFHERNGTLGPCGPVRDAREDPDHYDEIPAPGPEILIPGAFLDQHAAAPGDCPEELAAFLDAARPLLRGQVPVARVDIPVDLLEPLSAYADDRLMTWGLAQDRMAMKAAHILATHARALKRREDERNRPPAEPEPRPGHLSPFCVVDHPGVPYCPPF
ncbi:hypothetical protein [Streptomyces sp. A0642]|uniref:hypothetical protein n=1 Tax=Streptomyces sp. A0642 TaxID=2563100 RepID=UPI00144879D5|nr:hypothetical protein [Streptomyces sp. A0642]